MPTANRCSVALTRTRQPTFEPDPIPPEQETGERPNERKAQVHPDHAHRPRGGVHHAHDVWVQVLERRSVGVGEFAGRYPGPVHGRQHLRRQPGRRWHRAQQRGGRPTLRRGQEAGDPAHGCRIQLDHVRRQLCWNPRGAHHLRLGPVGSSGDRLRGGHQARRRDANGPTGCLGRDQ